jgi:hypothetical protein
MSTRHRYDSSLQHGTVYYAKGEECSLAHITDLFCQEVISTMTLRAEQFKRSKKICLDEEGGSEIINL